MDPKRQGGWGPLAPGTGSGYGGARGSRSSAGTARGENHSVARPRLQHPRAGGLAGWGPGPRGGRASPARALAGVAGQSLPPPRPARGLRDGCNNSQASGIFWLCCKASDPNITFLARLRSQLSRKNLRCVQCRLDTSPLVLADLKFYFKNQLL